MYAYTLKYETSMVNLVRKYLGWLQENDISTHETEKAVFGNLVNAVETSNSTTAAAFLHGDEWAQFVKRAKEWSSEQGEKIGMIKKELTFISFYETLLGFYIAVRDARLYGVAGIIQCLRDIEPLAVWSGRHSYSKLIPAQIATLLSAKSKFPFLWPGISDGTLLAVSRNGGPMDCVALDYALETGTNFYGKEIIMKIAARSNSLLSTLTVMPQIRGYKEAFLKLVGDGVKPAKKRIAKVSEWVFKPRAPMHEKAYENLLTLPQMIANVDPWQIPEEAKDDGDAGIDDRFKVWHSTLGHVASEEAATSMLGFPGVVTLTTRMVRSLSNSSAAQPLRGCGVPERVIHVAPLKRIRKRKSKRRRNQKKKVNVNKLWRQGTHSEGFAQSTKRGQLNSVSR